MQWNISWKHNVFSLCSVNFNYFSIPLDNNNFLSYNPVHISKMLSNEWGVAKR